MLSWAIQRRAIAVLCCVLSVGAAHAADAATSTTRGPVNCIVHLHGRGGSGFASAASSGGATWRINPTSNTEFSDGGHVWQYNTSARFADAKKVVQRAIASKRCERVVIAGFSNGAAFAAKLMCRGESFDNTVIGFVLADPVPDRVVDKCRPSPLTLGRRYVRHSRQFRKSFSGTGTRDCPRGWTYETGCYAITRWDQRASTSADPIIVGPDLGGHLDMNDPDRSTRKPTYEEVASRWWTAPIPTVVTRSSPTAQPPQTSPPIG